MRFFVFFIVLALTPSFAHAIEAPRAQIVIGPDKILRGHFVQQHQASGAKNPGVSAGHFTVAPAYGLIWGIEQPFPTSTIITPRGIAQDIGGLSVKLPSQNLQHLYVAIAAALAGDWSGLESDFIITPSVQGGRWQMVMTPRPGVPYHLPYATISVSGGQYVETIIMTKADATYDALTFSHEVLSAAQLTGPENMLFGKTGR